MTRRSRRSQLFSSAMVTFVAIATVGLVGCSSSTTTTAEARGLAGIPLYPGSSSFGPAHVTAGTTVHTFKVPDTTPAAVLNWYTGHLRQWTMTRSPAADPTATDLAGRWKRGSRRLQVSSAPAPTAHAVQYTLIGTTNGTALP